MRKSLLGSCSSPLSIPNAQHPILFSFNSLARRTSNKHEKQKRDRGCQ